MFAIATAPIGRCFIRLFLLFKLLNGSISQRFRNIRSGFTASLLLGCLHLHQFGHHHAVVLSHDIAIDLGRCLNSLFSIHACLLVRNFLLISFCCHIGGRRAFLVLVHGCFPVRTQCFDRVELYCTVISYQAILI